MEPENIFDKKDGVKIIEKLLQEQNKELNNIRQTWGRNPEVVESFSNGVILKYKKYNELFQNEDINNYFEISYNRVTLSNFQPPGFAPRNYFGRNDIQFIFKKFIILLQPYEHNNEKVELITHNLSNEILFCIKNININDINNNGLSLQKLISLYDKKQQDETIKQKHQEIKIKKEQDDIEKENKLFIKELIKRSDKITINKE
jgi:hypothetical protein